MESFQLKDVPGVGCTNESLIRSRKEEEELRMLKENIRIESGEIHVEYPFIKDPICLPNNKATAVKMAEKLESRLKREGMLEAYNEQFRQYIDREVFVKISEEEKRNYRGPCQYISHHGVQNNSATTPLRIVTNSSLKNGSCSLNDCLPKGLKSLNSQFDIGIRFRVLCSIFRKHIIGCPLELLKEI